MRRILGIDLGSRRIGIAIAEADALRARPLTTIARGRTVTDDADALTRIVAANGAGELVVGMPLDMSGAEGAAAVAARAWAGEIVARTGMPVTLRDERLSSNVAEMRIGRAPRGRDGGPPGPTRRAAHRARIDREAATVILEDELAARSLGEAGERVDASANGSGDPMPAPPSGPGDRNAAKSGTIARTPGAGPSPGEQQEPQ